MTLFAFCSFMVRLQIGSGPNNFIVNFPYFAQMKCVRKFLTSFKLLLIFESSVALPNIPNLCLGKNEDR